MQKKSKFFPGAGQRVFSATVAKKSQPCNTVGGFLPDGRVLAVPSWVLPGPVAENCRFIAGRADEAGLLFMKSRSSLAYSGKDLPLDLAELPLSWHAHLPLDLVWDGGAAVETCLALMEKIAFLGAERAVLHPPAAPAPLSAKDTEKRLTAFATAWKGAGRDPGHILLENTVEQDLTGLAPCIESCGFQVCLDLGHMLAGGRKTLTEFLPLAARAGMVHLNSTAPSGRHGPLTDLDGPGRELGRALTRAVPRSAVLMLECFAWAEIEASLPLVREWLSGGAAE